MIIIILMTHMEMILKMKKSNIKFFKIIKLISSTKHSKFVEEIDIQHKDDNDFSEIKEKSEKKLQIDKIKSEILDNTNYNKNEEINKNISQLPFKNGNLIFFLILF